MAPINNPPLLSLLTLPAPREAIVVEPLTVNLVAVVVAKVEVPTTVKVPEINWLPEITELPVVVALPETVKAVMEVVAKVELPVTVRVLKLGVEETAMVEVPEKVMLEPAVKKDTGEL